MILALLLAGCAPTPADIKFDGKPQMVVHSKDPVEVEKASVVDKDGKPIDPQPTVSWTVTPPTVATLAGSKVTPLANGEAKVEAAVGELKKSYTLKVALPDAIEIAGLTGPIGVGGKVKLMATVKAGADPVKEAKVEWKSSDDTKATVSATGEVEGKAVGTAKITAKSGDLMKDVDVTVDASVPVVADAKAPPPPAGAPDAKAPPPPPGKPGDAKGPPPGGKPPVAPPPGQGKGTSR